MKVVVSVGGSLIKPNEIDFKFLKDLEKTLIKISKHNQVAIICGGGRLAREYIEVLRKNKLDEETCSKIGIESTKMNAMLVQLFCNNRFKLSNTMKEVKENMEKGHVTLSYGLDPKEGMTTDGTSAELAAYVKADFLINMTDVKGLYDKNPKKFKNAKFIPSISSKDFITMVNKIKYKAGQHFVLDQVAARIIHKYKIPTVILKGCAELEKCVDDKPFIGTLII